LSKVLYAPGGTLAIGMALKLARAVTGRFKVVSFWDSFHGASLDAVSVGGERIFKKDMGPTLPGVEHIPPPNKYRGIFGNDEMKYADYFEYVVEKEGDIGALLAEPIRNTDGIIPTPAFWKRVREICDRHNILLIFDEIATGLGRTGKMFVYEHYDIIPDVVCLGKGLGGGIFPMAAILTKEKYNMVNDISIGHYTHEKNPVGAAAALATLEFIKNENILDKVGEDETYLKEVFRDWKDRYAVIGDVRGIGLLWILELVKDRESKEPAGEIAEKVMYGCLRDGLNFKLAQGNSIQLAPALTISREELNEALEILEKNLINYSK
jgi:4-aminobutyrate aminotransferase